MTGPGELSYKDQADYAAETLRSGQSYSDNVLEIVAHATIESVEFELDRIIHGNAQATVNLDDKSFTSSFQSVVIGVRAGLSENGFTARITLAALVGGVDSLSGREVASLTEDGDNPERLSEYVNTALCGFGDAEICQLMVKDKMVSQAQKRETANNFLQGVGFWGISARELVTGKQAGSDAPVGSQVGNAIDVAFGLAPLVKWAVKGTSGAKWLAGATSKIGGTLINTGDNAVYISVNQVTGEVQYVGRTNNVARRSIEHLANKGITIAEIPGLKNLSVDDARAVEQVLIEQYGGPNGGQLLNKINSIATSNPVYPAAIKRGCQILAAAGQSAPKVCS